MDDALRLLHSFRNLSQPVNRFPPEILSRIIRYVTHEDGTDALLTISLTRVCRYWREFIISTPRNWTSISNRYKNLAELSLQRAKAAPLKIDLDMYQFRWKSKFSRLINPYVQNIKTIHFSGFEKVKDLKQSLPNFPQSVPNLQSLTLAKYKHASQESHSIDPCESLAPSLKSLKLVGVPLCHSFLRLRALTELNFNVHWLDFHLDTLLDFLEENHSLQIVTLGIRFREPSLRHSQRGTAIMNRLQHLSINTPDAMDGKALISNIVLRRGAHLELVIGTHKRLKDLLPGTPPTQLSNLLSPIFMECQYKSRSISIQLRGPNGSFSFQEFYEGEKPSVESHLLPLTSVREFRLIHPKSAQVSSRHDVFNPSFFPALEALAVACGTWASHILSNLLSNPSFPPSLKTLAFLNCNLSGDFMEELTRFASDRKNTTSAKLRRVVIIDSQGNLPTIASIDTLGEHVPIVDIRVGKELPTDLT